MRWLCSALLFAHAIDAGTIEVGRPSKSSSLRIATYNVRYDAKPDNITVQETISRLPSGTPKIPERFYEDPTEQPWSTRRIRVANDILWSGAHVFGGQELLPRQVMDVQELLGPQWSWVGVGRDPDNPGSNEFNPVFFRNDLLELISWDTFWLSTTPFEASKVEDAGSFRVCTATYFSGPGISFTLLNTHLDDQSSEQRALGASLILYRAKYEAINTGRPVFLTGDFNSAQSDEAYQIITGDIRPKTINETFCRKFSWDPRNEKEFKGFTMMDLLAETPPHRRSGNYATFTDWSALDEFSSFERLDYIFAGPSSEWNVKAYHVGQSLYDDGVYNSDHRPVFAEIEIQHDDIRSVSRSSVARVSGIFRQLARKMAKGLWNSL